MKPQRIFRGIRVQKKQLFGVCLTETYLVDVWGSVLSLCNVDFVLLRELRLRPFSENSICIQKIT